MKIIETEIKGCYIIETTILSDERGWFSRVFCEETMKPILGELKFVQINHSFNACKGTFRGLHYQEKPYCEAKLIRCISGSVLDFALDIRSNSPTFLKSIGIELSSVNRKMIYIPEGVAHGFQTLEDNSELIYHHTMPFHKESDRGIRFDDPKVNINLPLPISLMSHKDKNYQLLTINFKGIQL